MGKISITFEFDNEQEAANFLLGENDGPVSPQPLPAGAANPVVPPQVAAVTAPPVTAPPATPPAPPAQPKGEAPPGWTIEHIKGAAQAFAADPAKGGPAALKAILNQYGAARAGEVDPAKWPELYQRLTG